MPSDAGTATRPVPVQGPRHTQQAWWACPVCDRGAEAPGRSPPGRDVPGDRSAPDGLPPVPGDRSAPDGPPPAPGDEGGPPSDPAPPAITMPAIPELPNAPEAHRAPTYGANPVIPTSNAAWQSARMDLSTVGEG